jgi:hypothetical protein
MANRPAITEENIVTSAEKSTRGSKPVLEGLADTGTCKTRLYRPPVLCAATFKQYKFREGGEMKRGPFVVNQIGHHPDTSTPHQSRSTSIVHPFHFQSPP